MKQETTPIKPDRGSDVGTPKVLKTTTIQISQTHLLQAIEDYLYRFYGRVTVAGLEVNGQGIYEKDIVKVTFDAGF